MKITVEQLIDTIEKDKYDNVYLLVEVDGLFEHGDNFISTSSRDFLFRLQHSMAQGYQLQFDIDLDVEHKIIRLSPKEE